MNGNAAVVFMCITQAVKLQISMQGKSSSIKLVCTDVDGTLLNSDNQLSEAARKAIQDANAQGIPVRA